MGWDSSWGVSRGSGSAVSGAGDTSILVAAALGGASFCKLGGASDGSRDRESKGAVVATEGFSMVDMIGRGDRSTSESDFVVS